MDENKIFEDQNRILNIPKETVLTQAFLKQYVKYAKKTVKPQLNDKAVEYISEAWSRLR